MREENIYENRKIKDSVFVDLFSTDERAKENFLSLYNALHGTDLRLEETEIVHQRLERTLYMGFRNDVSALINGSLLVLVEHQSTVNENMPLRFLEYVAELYKQVVPPEKRYQRKTEQIPAPEFYVLYNGADDYPSEKTLRLSDAFEKNKMSENGAPPLEILVKVININTEKHADVLGRCRVLADYSKFMELVRTERLAGNAAFVRDAVHTALSRGVLSEYLSRKRWEVDDMTFAEYNYDMDIAVQRREAFEDGQEQGEHKARLETARGMLADCMPVQSIAKYTGLSIEELQNITPKE